MCKCFGFLSVLSKALLLCVVELGIFYGVSLQLKLFNMILFQCVPVVWVLVLVYPYAYKVLHLNPLLSVVFVDLV